MDNGFFLIRLVIVVLCTTTGFCLNVFDHLDSDGLLNLNDDLYGRYVKPKSRKQYFAVLLTSSQQDCEMCHHAKDSLKDVMASFNKAPATENLRNKVVFVVAPYENCRELFTQLQLSHIPFLLLLKPKQSVTRGRLIQAMSASDIGRQLSDMLDVRFTVEESQTLLSTGPLLIAFAVICMPIAFFRTKGGQRSFVALICIGWTLVFSGGLMWVLMHPQMARWFMSDRRSNSWVFISPSNDHQLAGEVFIIAGLRGLISLAVVVLANVRLFHCGVKMRSLVSFVALVVVSLTFYKFVNLVSMKMGYSVSAMVNDIWGFKFEGLYE